MIRILAVCTGNICRSPMAAALLRAGAPVVGLDVQVASAGVIASGHPADPHAVSVMADRGIDLSGHRSHRLETVDLDAADLVLTMAQEHIVEIGARHPESLGKTFTIKELVRRASLTGPKALDQPLGEYLAPLDSYLRRQEVLRRDPSDDVADPVGMGRRAFQRTAEELDALVWSVLDLLAGRPGDRSVRDS